MAWKVINEQEVLRMYQEDETLTLAQLARDYGVSKDKIRRILVKNGVAIRQMKHLTSKAREEICQKYFEENVSSYDLVKMYEVNYTSIRKILMADSRYKKCKVRLEQEERESIIRQYLDEDITHAELAKRYGSTRAWISHIINETDIEDERYRHKRKRFEDRKKTPRRKLSVTADVLIEELKKPGVSQRSLAEKYNVSESCIYHAIARYKGKRQ